MTVLTIIGIILAVIIVLLIMDTINKQSLKRFGVDFFTIYNFIAVFIGYIFIYFGNNNLQNAIANNGDQLNGQLVIIIGIVILIGVLIDNIKSTNLSFGLTYSILMIVIYATATPVALLGIIILFLILADTKPVINLN